MRQIFKKKETKDTIEFPARIENFEKAGNFIRDFLNTKGVSREITSETMLVFEALFHSILEQEGEKEPMLSLSCRNSLGELRITIHYEGELFYLFPEGKGEISPEKRILRAYEDKISSNYRLGMNMLQITVKRVHLRTMLFCLAAALFAALLSLMLREIIPDKAQNYIAAAVLLPLEEIFGAATLMIGAPVTFFSLLRNLSEAYILSERYTSIRKLRLKAILSSVFLVILAVVVGYVLLKAAAEMAGAVVDISAPNESAAAVRDWILGIVPGSIFEPFESLSPMPLIFLALLVTYAFCSSGKYFSKLMKAVDICYSLFSKMLGLIISCLPVFCFIVTIQMMIFHEKELLMYMFLAVGLILASTVVILIFYGIRLKLAGVSLRAFVKPLPALLLENARINSAIDAVPFNIRYCVRNYGINKNRLEQSLPVLAQINLEGNSYLLMMIAMLFGLSAIDGITWFSIVTLASLVILMSFGAPNQPGSILIGTTIILKFLGLQGLISFAVFMELFLGLFQNLYNVLGDVVTLSIEEQRARKKLAKQMN